MYGSAAMLDVLLDWLGDAWSRIGGWLTDPRQRRPSWDRKPPDDEPRQSS